MPLVVKASNWGGKSDWNKRRGQRRHVFNGPTISFEEKEEAEEEEEEEEEEEVEEEEGFFRDSCV